MNTETQNNDFDLIKRYRKGDKEALNSLISRYQNRLYHVILKICNSPEDALELTQDSFVKAIENIEKFKGNSTFYTYLYRIGVNLAINFSNRRKKMHFLAIDNAADDQGLGALKDYLVDKTFDDPAQIVQNDEAIAILRQQIADIEEKYRVVLVLRDIEEMTYEQIAQTLELEEGTVKSRLFRGRAMLREKLLAKFEELGN